MFEIIVAIIVVVCIIYIFKGDFTRKNVGVTVLEGLPLSIFKKWVKEEKNIKEEVAIEVNDIKFNMNKNSNCKNDNDRNSEVLEEVAIDILEEEIEEVESVNETSNIEEVNSEEKDESIEALENINKIEEKLMEEFDNCSENVSDILSNNVEESIENKDIIEISNEEEEKEEEAEIVYWTPRGKTYHIKNTCRTLARSKVINSGTVYESGKDFQCEHCK
ncbi:hypothetical protein ABFP60_13490 [Clostridioides difficile]